MFFEFSSAQSPRLYLLDPALAARPLGVRPATLFWQLRFRFPLHSTRSHGWNSRRGGFTRHSPKLTLRGQLLVTACWHSFSSLLLMISLLLNIGVSDVAVIRKANSSARLVNHPNDLTHSLQLLFICLLCVLDGAITAGMMVGSRSPMYF